MMEIDKEEREELLEEIKEAERLIEFAEDLLERRKKYKKELELILKLREENILEYSRYHIDKKESSAVIFPKE